MQYRTDLEPSAQRLAGAAASLAGRPASSELWERARESMPGGIPAFGSVSTPIYWDRGEGAYMYDVDGNRFLDLAAGQGALILGNSVPEVRDAIVAQASRSYYVQTPWPEVIELAELLQSRFPAAERVRFIESGSKAANLAVRLARGFTGRPKIAKFVGGYHGVWDEALVNPPTRYSGGVFRASALPGIPDTASGNLVLLPWNEPEACEKLIREHADELGGIILEPVLGDGYLEPVPGFLALLRELCDAHDIVLVYDEAITQSLAPGGAQEYYGVVPDLTTIAKSAIGGGMPLAAVGGRADIMGLTDPYVEADLVPSGSTFASHAVTVAAGLAQARLLTPTVYARLAALGERLREGLNQLAEKYPETGLHASGVGNLTFLHRRSIPPGTYNEHLECDAQTVNWWVSELVEEGYITAAGGRLHTSAPMTDADIDGFVESMARVLERTPAMVAAPAVV